MGDEDGVGATGTAELGGAAGTVCVVATGAPGVAMLLDGVNVEANTNEGRDVGAKLLGNAVGA